MEDRCPPQGRVPRCCWCDGARRRSCWTGSWCGGPAESSAAAPRGDLAPAGRCISVELRITQLKETLEHHSCIYNSHSQLVFESASALKTCPLVPLPQHSSRALLMTQQPSMMLRNQATQSATLDTCKGSLVVLTQAGFRCLTG